MSTGPSPWWWVLFAGEEIGKGVGTWRRERESGGGSPASRRRQRERERESARRLALEGRAGSDPILFPKLRIRFADFPCLHCSIGQRLFTLET